MRNDKYINIQFNLYGERSFCVNRKINIEEHKYIYPLNGSNYALISQWNNNFDKNLTLEQIQEYYKSHKIPECNYRYFILFYLNNETDDLSKWDKDTKINLLFKNADIFSCLL